MSSLPAPRESESISFQGLTVQAAGASQLTVRVITLDGKSVFTATGSRTLTLPSTLTNGVYLAIVEAREAGRVIGAKVEKVVISH